MDREVKHVNVATLILNKGGITARRAVQHAWSVESVANT